MDQFTPSRYKKGKFALTSALRFNAEDLVFFYEPALRLSREGGKATSSRL